MSVNLIKLNEHQEFSIVYNDGEFSLCTADEKCGPITKSTKDGLIAIGRANFKKFSSRDKAKKIEELRLLGAAYDANDEKFKLSYYIGVDWIDEQDNTALMVKPKIEGIDYQQMFLDCLKDDHINKDHPIDELFYVNPNARPIEIPTKDFNDLEPLIIAIFVNNVKMLIKSGLKKDYVNIEDNLTSKIKGRILMSQHVKKNVSQMRTDKAYCKYQEYSIDCVENRLLKCALLHCRKFINNLNGYKGNALQREIDWCLPALQQVTPNISRAEIRKVRINPIFKQYKRTIPIAKMILNKESHLIDHNNSDSQNEKQRVPPFTIDMALLFERYVYHLLHEVYGSQIKFQIESKHKSNIMDFCKSDEHIVIDSKYKRSWANSIDHENVRQLSGYARLAEFREEPLGLQACDDTTICPCLIVYPNKQGKDSFPHEDKLLSKCDPIGKYIQFYKFGIKLPMKK